MNALHHGIFAIQCTILVNITKALDWVTCSNVSYTISNMYRSWLSSVDTLWIQINFLVFQQRTHNTIHLLFQLVCWYLSWNWPVRQKTSMMTSSCIILRAVSDGRNPILTGLWRTAQLRDQRHTYGYQTRNSLIQFRIHGGARVSSRCHRLEWLPGENYSP